MGEGVKTPPDRAKDTRIVRIGRFGYLAMGTRNRKYSGCAQEAQQKHAHDHQYNLIDREIATSNDQKILA